MLHFLDGLRNVTLLSTFFRLMLACVIGGFLGLERSYNNKPAGFRTHILVCLGGCVASMTGLYLYLVAGLATDMSRIGANVISGLGFIGAGTIFVTHKKTIKGLTTAAGLWTAGIIGLAVGAGFYEGAFLGMILVLLTETVFTRLRDLIQHTPPSTLAVSYTRREELDIIVNHLRHENCKITNLKVAGNTNAQTALYNALITLQPNAEMDFTDICRDLEQIDGVVSAEIL
ncbi:MAG: MgtC/SapB family protein [Solobacterium sp.]|nr:MgtC/SapB family protein [Solobacterium sp.]